MASISPTSRPFHFSHLHTGPFARPAPPKTASNSLTTAAHLSSSLMSLMGLNLIFHLIESSGTLVSPLSHRLSAPHGLIFLAWADALINGPKHSFINSSPIAPSLPGRTAGLDTFQYLPSAPRPLLKLTRSKSQNVGSWRPNSWPPTSYMPLKQYDIPLLGLDWLLPTAFTDQAKLSPLSSSSKTHL